MSFHTEMNKDVVIHSSLYPDLLNEKFEKPDIEVSLHHLSSNTIVIIYPGANGSKDGYENKYTRMAEKLVDSNIGAVIRSSNKYMLGNGWTTCLEIVIQYALEYSEEICGSKNPQLFLVGHSAGAGAVDLVCSAYEQVKKVLLTSPAPIKRHNISDHGITEFEGEVHVRIPENDIIPREEGMEFYDLASNSSKRTLEIVEDCDHEWSGETNLLKFIELPSKLL